MRRDRRWISTSTYNQHVFIALIFTSIHLQTILGLEININGSGIAVLNESYMFRCYVSPTANIRNVVTFTRRGAAACEIVKPCRVYNRVGYSCGCTGVSGNTTVYSLTVSSVSRRDETGWICTHGTTNRSNTYNLTVNAPVNTVSIKVGGSMPNTVNITEGNSAVFRCVIQGAKPAPTIFQVTWYREVSPGNKESLPGVVGSPITTNRTTWLNLSYTADRQHQYQKVFCSATNSLMENRSVPAVISSNKIQLNILYSPTNAPEIKGYQTGTPVYESNMLNISCEVKGGNPVVSSVNLTCYGGHQSKESHTKGDTVTAYLSFQVSKDLNNQLCTCSASHVTNTYSKTDRETITVYYPPSVPTVQPEPGFPWLEGDDNRRLTCSLSDRGNPPCTYVWFRDGVEDSSQTSSSYTFSTLTYTDNGRRFSCQAQNAYTVHRHDPSSLTLNVYYNPRLTLSKSGPIRKREGERLDAINCTATSNPPNPTFRWTSNSSIQWTGGLPLQIPVLDRGNHGTYTCTATVSSSRGNLTGTSQINIIVNYAPDVNITGQAMSEGNSMTITCEYSGRPDSYSFHGFNHSWGDQLIRTVKGIKVKPNKYVWTVNSATYEDSGVYQCSVDNTIPDRNNTVIQSSTTSVLVKGKPVITLESERDNTLGEEIGQQVTMYKTVFSLENITRHQWIKNGNNLTGNVIETNITDTRITLNLFEKVKINETGYNFTLKIKMFNESDEGQYRLEVCNTFDCGTFSTNLSAAGPPYTPSLFSAFGSTIDTVFLKWVAGFPGGHYTQRFLVEYKESGQDTDWKQEWYYDHADRNQEVHMNITGLQPAQSYVFRVLAENTRDRKNRSDFTHEQFRETKDLPKPTTDSQRGALTGGIAGGSVALVIILAVVAAVLVRRRVLRKQNGRNAKNDHTERGLPLPVLEENYIYNLEDDGGTKKPELPELKDNEIYNLPENGAMKKPELPAMEDNEIYYFSDNADPKKEEISTGSPKKAVNDGVQPSTSASTSSENPDNLYTTVVKSCITGKAAAEPPQNNVDKDKKKVDKKGEKNMKKREKEEKAKDKGKKGKGVDKKMKKGKKDDKIPLKQVSVPRGDAYENVEPGQDNTYANAAFDGKEDAVCENIQGAKCGRDEDGLVYVRIDFPKNPPRKPVHNTEDHVEYISIDWNKKAEPLPDDEEQKKQE